MKTASSIDDPRMEVVQPIGKTNVPRSTAADVGEWVLRFVVVVVGVVLGMIFAFFIGLTAGWIQFC